MNPIRITGYNRSDRLDVRDLLFRNYRTHSHLDWYHDADAWLDEKPPVCLARQNGRLVGLLGASPPLHGTSWIRLAALRDDVPAGTVMRGLWNGLADELRARGVETVALLLLREWITAPLTELGFAERDEIITLRRAGQYQRQPPPAPPGLRLTDDIDLEAIVRVDQTAFAPPWQLALDELRQATRMAASCTAALLHERVVGYQLSTLYFDGAHLARLAVAPTAQGQGVGAMLVHDLLCRLGKRGIHSTTVNTQSTNARSQRLYQRFGFARNHYDLPVWMTDL